MKYTKIKRDTEAYQLVHNIFNYQKKWSENNAEIEAFLGFPTNKNLYLNVNDLVIAREKVKPEWESEFKKNTNPAETKTNSKLRKEWIGLCKRLGLETYHMRDFTLKYGIWGSGITAHRVADDYYLETKDEFDISRYDWAEPTEEHIFLRAKADFLENEKSA